MKTEEEKRQPEGRPDADYNREEFLEKILKHRIACFESLDTPHGIIFLKQHKHWQRQGAGSSS